MAHADSTQEVLLGQLVDKAFTLAQSGDFSSAIANLEAACRSDAAKGSTHEMLAQFFLEGDRPHDAVQAAQKAVDLDDQVDTPRLFSKVLACCSIQDWLDTTSALAVARGSPDPCKGKHGMLEPTGSFARLPFLHGEVCLCLQLTNDPIRCMR